MTRKKCAAHGHSDEHLAFPVFMSNFLRYADEWHGSVPIHSITRNTALSPKARLLWVILQSYCSPNSPNPFPTRATLQREMGHSKKSCSKDTLSRLMRELSNAGALRYEQEKSDQGRWGHNVYTLTAPKCIQSPWAKTTDTVKHGRGKSRTPSNADSVKSDTSTAPSTENNHQQRKKEKPKETQLSPSGAASPQPGGSGRCSVSAAQTASLQKAIEFEDLPIGERLTQVWQAKYRCWYGHPYRVREIDRQSVEDFCSDDSNDAAALGKVMQTAMAGWIDLVKAPVRPASTQHDPYFYRRRSDKLGYALRNIVGLQAEMEQSKYTAYFESDIPGIIQRGKAAYLQQTD